MSQTGLNASAAPLAQSDDTTSDGRHALPRSRRLTRNRTQWLCAALLSMALVLVAGQAAMSLPDAWLGMHAAQLRTHFVDRFFPFDSLWYAQIAKDWYRWDPAQAKQFQDVAFFPLWPAVLWLVHQLGAPTVLQRWVTFGVAAGVAVASIRAFQRLAQRLLPPQASHTATWLFALYPAANFNIQSYPTGLMNLLTVAALLALLDQRFLRAALWCGLLTAAGPLGLGTAMATCMCAALASSGRLRAARAAFATARAARVWQELLWLGGISLLSISGLLTFLGLQAIKFGDPFAFMKAQNAWEPQLAFMQRFPAALAQAAALPDFYDAVRGLKHIAHPPSLIWLQITLQRSLYEAFLGCAIVSIVISARLRCWPVLLQGSFTVALFIWFHSAVHPGNSTFRLLYCAMPIFLGSAWMLRDRPVLTKVAIAFSACLLAAGAFLTAAGYSVV